VMFLYRPSVRFDSRVLREARALTNAGHDVRIITGRPGGAPEERIGAIRVIPVDIAPLLSKAKRRLAPRRTVGAGARETRLDEWTPMTAGQRPLARSDSRSPLMRLARGAYNQLFWLKYGRMAIRTAGREAADAWVAHDLDTLPFAARARRKFGGRLVYDSHELYMDRVFISRSRLARWRWATLERLLIRRVDHVMTVSDAFASTLARRYRIRSPTVVLNVPELGDATGEAASLRERLGLSPSSRLVVYLGGLLPTRGLEHLILVAGRCPDLAVALMGYGPADYVESLRAKIAASHVDDRVYPVAPVAPERVVAHVASADVGYLAPSYSGLNTYLTLPNKLFEYIAAGVPVVASPFPSIREVVEHYDVGATCDPNDVDAIIDAIRSIVDDPERHRRLRDNALAASRRFRWEVEAPTLVRAVAGRDGAPPPARS
jgi:glycosyltransferase involved in cell wall biosynthesis